MCPAPATAMRTGFMRAPRSRPSTPSSAMPAASASATSASRSSTSVCPASTASAPPPPLASVRSVARPMVGTSKRGSWPGFATFTTTTPRPRSARLAPRSIARSVPSTASSASTALPCTTTLWPTSSAPIAFAIGQPNATSCSCSGVGRTLPSTPAGAHRSGASSSWLRTRRPSSSITCTTAPSSESSLRSRSAANAASARASGRTSSRRSHRKRLRHLAGQRHVGGAGRAQHLEQAVELRHVRPREGVHVSLERGIRQADEPDRRHAPAGAPRARGELRGQVAAAGHEAERRHQRETPRSELSMKATRRFTSGETKPSLRTAASASSRRSRDQNRSW